MEIEETIMRLKRLSRASSQSEWDEVVAPVITHLENHEHLSQEHINAIVCLVTKLQLESIR